MSEGPAPAAQPPQNPPEQQSQAWKLIVLFAFAVCAFAILILLAKFDPNPSQTNWYIYLTLLALASAGVAALLPGAINFEVPGSLKAGGALAVFALIFYLGSGKAAPVSSTFTMSAFLTFANPPNPFDSDVYVVVNNKVAKADTTGSHAALYAVEDQTRNSTIQVNRGAGGLRIDFGKLVPGDRIYVRVFSESKQWRSDDILVPEGQWSMTLVGATTPP
ncbi:MAG TPA: hypothetical protein VGJ51_18745 [Candidatus Angelobacter sp.]|jgi:hypothetical protein